MSTYAVKTPEKAEAGEIIAGHAPAERRASVSSSLDAMLDTEFLQKNLAQTKSLKQKLWDLMDDAGSSRAANTISLLIMVLIAVSCVAFVVETIPEIYASESAKAVLSTIEAVCSILFTIEYLLRFFSAPDKIAFLKGVLNFVDLIAVAPWYIEKLLPSGEGGGTAFVRIIRLVRVFRVLKVSRYLTWVRLFASALGKSSQPLAMLLFIIVIAMIFFSSIMFTAEKGVWSHEHSMWVLVDDMGTPAPFQSIPDTFYWCIITMTTVGYGDVYPATWFGQLVAIIASLCGILVLAIPITVISTNFNSEYEQLQKQQEIIRARMLLLKQHFAKRRSGMDALQSEIREMGKRSTSQLMAEIHKTVEKSQAILTEELNEIIRVAYIERQKELEKAGFSSEVEVERKRLKEQGVAAGEFRNSVGAIFEENDIQPEHNHTQFRHQVNHTITGQNLS
jgi:hypothetical protein